MAPKERASRKDAGHRPPQLSGLARARMEDELFSLEELLTEQAAFPERQREEIG